MRRRSQPFVFLEDDDLTDPSQTCQSEDSRSSLVDHLRVTLQETADAKGSFGDIARVKCGSYPARNPLLGGRGQTAPARSPASSRRRLYVSTSCMSWLASRASDSDSSASCRYVVPRPEHSDDALSKSESASHSKRQAEPLLRTPSASDPVSVTGKKNWEMRIIPPPPLQNKSAFCAELFWPTCP